MITTYSYRILSTNPALGAMTVEFSSPGYATVEVGARMPFVGEPLNEFMTTVAPIGFWLDSKKIVATVEVGASASVAVPVVGPVEPPVAGPPTRVTKFQAKAALIDAGLYDEVEAYMALPTTPQLTKLAWTEALHFERASPTVAGLAALLNLNSTQLDTLFLNASQIEA